MAKRLLEHEEYGECRSLNHSWKRIGLERYGPEVLLVLRCRACSTEREDMVSLATGDVERRYRYAKDYVLKFAPNEARPYRSDFRREWIRTVLEEASGHVIRLPKRRSA